MQRLRSRFRVAPQSISQFLTGLYPRVKTFSHFLPFLCFCSNRHIIGMLIWFPVHHTSCLRWPSVFRVWQWVILASCAVTISGLPTFAQLRVYKMFLQIFCFVSRINFYDRESKLFTIPYITFLQKKRQNFLVVPKFPSRYTNFPSEYTNFLRKNPSGSQLFPPIQPCVCLCVCRNPRLQLG